MGRGWGHDGNRRQPKVVTLPASGSVFDIGLVHAEARRWGSGIERLLNLGAAANGNGDSEPMDRRHPNYPQIYFNHPHNARNAILAAQIPHPTHSISRLVVAKHKCVLYI